MGYVAASIRFINLMKRKVLQIPALILEIPMTNQISGYICYSLFSDQEISFLIQFSFCSGAEAWVFDSLSGIYYGYLFLCGAQLCEAKFIRSSEGTFRPPTQRNWGYWSCNLTSWSHGYAVWFLSPLIIVHFHFINFVLFNWLCETVVGTISSSIQHWFFPGRYPDQSMESK